MLGKKMYNKAVDNYSHALRFAPIAKKDSQNV